MRSKNAQVGVEYLIIVGLVTFIIMTILLMSFYYSNSAQEMLKLNQIESFGNKVIASAETISYYGFPAKVTIEAYLPDGVSSIEVIDNNLIITSQQNTAINRRAFFSKVPITGSITNTYGLKKIKLEALESGVLQISMA